MKKEKVNDLKGIRKPELYKQAYSRWSNIHWRVEHDPNYSGVTICTDWYIFSLFYKWYAENYSEGWQIDKDILGGNEYSPNNCIFVPCEVNLLYRDVKTSIQKGVVKNNKGYQSQITIGGINQKLGTFETIEDASRAYETARTERIKALSVQYPQLKSIIK